MPKAPKANLETKNSLRDNEASLKRNKRESRIYPSFKPPLRPTSSDKQILETQESVATAPLSASDHKLSKCKTRSESIIDKALFFSPREGTETLSFSVSVSLEDLFRYLETITLPSPTTPEQALNTSASKGLRQRTKTFFTSHNSSNELEKQTEPHHPINNSVFLKKVRKFFRREKKFWKTFFRDFDTQNSAIDGNANTNRPWAMIFNVYVSENPTGALFYHCLSPERVKNHCAIFTLFIELEHAKSNTENTLESLPIIERAQMLLDFLETHKDDPYSCVVGLQASQPIVTACINNAAPSTEGVKFDLSRYILEVSTLKSDIELAKNVRVLSAKLRGIFTNVTRGSIVLLSLPNADESVSTAPGLIKVENKFYPVEASLREVVEQFDASFIVKPPSSGAFRACFARCAVKPTNDNWIGLWMGPNETEDTIVWAPVGRIYSIKKEHLEMLLDPSEDTSQLSSLVINYAELTEKAFCQLIEDSVIFQVRRQMSLDDETFTRMMRSRTLFIDEQTMIKMNEIVQQLLDDHKRFLALNLVEKVMAKRDNILEKLNPERIFALERRKVLKELRLRSRDDFTALAKSVITKLTKSCESRLEMLQIGREKVLDGSRKKHVTGWWLKETRRTVQTFLKECGYSYEAIPKDYTNTPPDNLSLVQQNLEAVMRVLDTESNANRKLKEVIEGLKGRVYPRMDALLHDFYAVMLYAVGEEVTEETIEAFKLDSIVKKLADIQDTLDSTLVRQINDMIKDVEYLSMMEVLEKDPAQRVNHPHIVPISGLVESSIVRLQSECRTVLEMWQPKEPVKKEEEKSKIPKVRGTNDMGIITSLKMLGIDVDTIDEHQRTALHVCCSSKEEIDTARILLELTDIDVNVKDDADDTPLHYLARLQVQSEEQRQILLSIVKKMKKLKVKINRENAKGETPLFLAVQNENETLARSLLEMKANVNIKDRNGTGILKLLKEHPSKEIANCLIKKHRIAPEDVEFCFRRSNR